MQEVQVPTSKTAISIIFEDMTSNFKICGCESIWFELLGGKKYYKTIVK